MKYDLIYRNPGSVEKVEGETMAEAIAAKTDERDPFMVVATKTVTTEGEPYECLMEKPGRVRIISKWSVDGADPNDKTKIVEADTILEALGGSSGVKKPVFSVPSGDIGRGETVEITCAIEGAVIYYTTDGSDPTSASTQYSTPIEITTDVTLKAIAILDESESKIATATYHVVIPTVATPTMNPNPGNIGIGESVTIECATDGATIYYTDDGSTPTSASTQYTTPIVINADITLKAIAIKADYNDSAVKTGVYHAVMPTVATPVIVPASGSVEAGSTATITCETDGAEIHYTVDGTAPDTSSPVYSDAIAITDGMTIKAIGIKSGYNNSAVASANYTVALPSYYGWVPGTEWGTDESRLSDIMALNSAIQSDVEFTYNFVGTATEEDGAFMVYAHPTSIGLVHHVKDKVHGLVYDESVTYSTITLNGAEYQLVRWTDYLAPEIGEEFPITYSANPIN